jgi:two-component system, LytTR family, response regulator
MKLSCLIIDDEEIAARGVEGYVRQVPYFENVHLCDSALKAMDILANNPIDIIFLDIEMPKLTGLQFLKSLTSSPLVVIISAYSDYALESYELEVMDYIVKPFSFDRFLKACNKCKEYADLKNRPGAASDEGYFFIKANNRIEKIMTNEVLFIEALENYINIYTAHKKYLSLVGLNAIESYLDSRQFIKVQKSYVVAKSKIDSIEGNMLHIGDHSIPVSRKWREEILANILSNKFLKR